MARLDFRIIALFVFCLLMFFTVQIFRTAEQSPAASGDGVTNARFYSGIRKPTSDEIQIALSEAPGKPVLLEFSSRYCHDCKRLEPVLKKAVAGFPQVWVKSLEISDDRMKEPVLFKTFRPTTVPVMIFITPEGAIQDVVYGYIPESKLRSKLQRLVGGSA